LNSELNFENFENFYRKGPLEHRVHIQREMEREGRRGREREQEGKKGREGGREGEGTPAYVKTQ